jgi:hypothetical protein
MMFDVLGGAIGLMQKGPRPLEKTLTFSADINSADEPFAIEGLRAYLEAAHPGDNAAGVFRRALAGWDNETAAWAAGTQPNSPDRRILIYKLLELDPVWVKLCDEKFPFHPLAAPVVIAIEHEPWYTEEVRKARQFYWTAYTGQLAAQGWSEGSIRQLDGSTTSIVERLADPTSEKAYQSKGLVVGYVQSGKTANFTGVVAKAADAGYKLIVILAGTLDVLRSQTQRRVDKEMIGRELLDRDYVSDSDWDKFLSHGAKPSDLGAFDWYRLTGPESDYKKLARGVEALQFESIDQSKPLWNKDNLFQARTRIAIVKKHSKVLDRLLSDLRLLARGRIGAPLDQVPTLIIDDESDQASINAQKNAPAGVVQERTATNKAIVDLLRLLPRAQYVGYTATPFANVFVDPNSEEDIFPKDFLVSLPRPEGYMGVSDFYDLEGSEQVEGSQPNKDDYIWPVKGNDTKAENLPRAIDSFVLSGAIKLFRKSIQEDLNYRHHTMLAHSSTRVAEQENLADLIQNIFAHGGYDGGKGLKRLELLFNDDFKRVHATRGNGLSFPAGFDQLLPFIGECLSRIGDSRYAILKVNNENKDETPDFDKQSVWKILVGGMKLSRGYTVEGLTISYYRRRAQTADTLMQMGRWFGFRRGYQDLVRLYIGTEEPLNKSGKNTIDLYEAFGAICRDEEMFREELKRYAEVDSPRVTPAQIPPLVPSHMLRPTAANKMYNAVLTYRNFGPGLSESTFAPTLDAEITQNNKSFAALVSGVTLHQEKLQARVANRFITLSSYIGTLSPVSVIRFLSDYRWYDPKDIAGTKRGNPMALQIDFLKQTGANDPGIVDWLLFAPQIQSPRAVVKIGDKDFDVVFRSRQEDAKNRFNTYNDPIHRAFAEYISEQKELPEANVALAALRRPRRAVLLYYPVTDIEKPGRVKPPYTVAFTLLFPKNTIRSRVAFSVVRKDQPNATVVPSAVPD